MILLTDYWDENANLVIELSREFTDSASKAELETRAYRDLPEEHKQKRWTTSFLVDGYARACQEVYTTYVKEGGENSPRLIDNVWGVLVND
ncbi:hypothetical protein GTY54_41620 [Streptomyces sp. SID625]|nr:hypothetical protein [Streptomyces sp. SID625]